MPNDVRVRFTAQDNVSQQAGRISSTVKGAFLGIGAAAGFAATAVAGDFARAITTDAISAAANFEESMNKVRQVFGEASQAVVDFAADTEQNILLTQQAALEAAGTFGNLIVSLGGTRDVAAQMSTRLVALASDLASFNNIATDEALTALRSGLVGEIEPLRRLGVSFSAAEVEARALADGLARTKEEIDEADKVTARYNLILDQTRLAQGDAARTSGDFTNSMRILNRDLAEMQREIGTALLPAMQELVSLIREELVPSLQRATDSFTTMADAAAKLKIPLDDLFDVLTVSLNPVEKIPEVYGNAIDRIRQIGHFFGIGGDATQGFSEDVEASMRALHGQEEAFANLVPATATYHDGARAARDSTAELGIAAVNAANDLSTLTARALATKVALAELRHENQLAGVDFGEFAQIVAEGASVEIEQLIGQLAETAEQEIFVRERVDELLTEFGLLDAAASSVGGSGGSLETLEDRMKSLSDNFQEPINIEAWRVWRLAQDAISVGQDGLNEKLRDQTEELRKAVDHEKALAAAANARVRAMAIGAELTGESLAARLIREDPSRIAGVFRGGRQIAGRGGGAIDPNDPYQQFLGRQPINNGVVNINVNGADPGMTMAAGEL